MVALGHVATASAYTAALDQAEQTAIAAAYEAGADPRKAMPETYDDDDWEPPLQTLLFWSEAWRLEHGYPMPNRPTEATEANFLRWALDWAWDNEPHWDDFADDVRKAKARMENLLREGERAARSRVVCDRPKCREKPRQLLKIHGPRFVAAWKCRCCETVIPERYRCEECNRRYAPRAGRCPRPVGLGTCGGPLLPMVEDAHCPTCWTAAPPEPIYASDPADDRWKCPGCKHRFDAGEFETAYRNQLRSEGSERYVPLPDALDVLRGQGRPERTIRRWFELNKVEAYCDAQTHAVLVWWPDLWRLHLATPMRRRERMGA
jgi:hypothetical protein